MGRRDEMVRELKRLVDMAGPRAAAALVAMFELRQREIQGLRDHDRGSVAAAEAQQDLLPLAQAASHWMNIHGRNETLQLSAADAYRLAGRCNDALHHYDDLLADHPDAIEVLYGRAECLYSLGGSRDEEAMDHYRRLAVAATNRLDEHYWQSQLRMLQILRRTGRNTHRIAPYIQQLRSKDPELGGAWYRREFERLLQ
jgi:tetratricopeptide (TPR) repeat protein